MDDPAHVNVSLKYSFKCVRTIHLVYSRDLIPGALHPNLSECTPDIFVEQG